MRSGQTEEHGVNIKLAGFSVANFMTENKQFCLKMEQCLFRKTQYGTNSSLHPRRFCMVISFVATTVRACTCVSVRMWGALCMFIFKGAFMRTLCVRVFVCVCTCVCGQACVLYANDGAKRAYYAAR